MRKKAADDQIDWLSWLQPKNVCHLVIDRIARIGSVTSAADRLSIYVDATKRDGDAVAVGPTAYSPQQIAVAATDVQEAQGPVLGNTRDSFSQPTKNRKVSSIAPLKRARSRE